MNSLNIGGLKARLPIIQGGMGVGISLSGLASAVANEGGIGVISAVGIGLNEPNYSNNFRDANRTALIKEIRKAKAKTKGIIGINIMLALTDFDEILNIGINEKIDVVFMGAGLPLKIPSIISQQKFENTKTKFVPKVSSAKAAKLIFQYWSNKYQRVPDAVVVEGPKSGGHQGFKKKDLNDPNINIFNLIKETIPEIDKFEQQYGIEIPIIAAGGIYTGKDIFEIMQAGAKGVKMGTRFVTTDECDAAMSFKKNYLSCKKEDITIIDSPVGLPGRVIRNNFVDQILNGAKKPIKCPWKCLKTCDYKEVPFCIAKALINSAKGYFSEGFSFAGTNAYLADKIQTVKETFSELILEYDTLTYMKTIEKSLQFSNKSVA
ncbi:MAG: nitronate monooxygenase [Bacteroidales bacterium]|nr:nitronate monooxygenase [Bacteroidales bacterium]